MGRSTRGSQGGSFHRPVRAVGRLHQLRRPHPPGGRTTAASQIGDRPAVERRSAECCRRIENGLLKRAAQRSTIDTRCGNVQPRAQDPPPRATSTAKRVHRGGCRGQEPSMRVSQVVASGGARTAAAFEIATGSAGGTSCDLEVKKRAGSPVVVSRRGGPSRPTAATTDRSPRRVPRPAPPRCRPAPARLASRWRR